jgi:hypothetical protein
LWIGGEKPALRSFAKKRPTEFQNSSNFLQCGGPDLSPEYCREGCVGYNRGEEGCRMNSEDFVERARGRFASFWLAKEPLSTPLGNVDIELREPPDEELLACAGKLRELVINNIEEILDLAYENYKNLPTYRGRIVGCQVPAGLARRKLRKYIERCVISVDRDANEVVSASFHMSLEWDTEHGLSLGFDENGGVQVE